MTQSGHWSRAQQIHDALRNLPLPHRMAALIISIVDQEPRAMDAVAAIISTGYGALFAARAAHGYHFV